MIADHIRSLTFVLSEGGQFSNEGRGYVLRRILRRAVRHGRRLGFEGPFLHRLVPKVAEMFDGIYDLPDAVVGSTIQTLEQEEYRFFRTIDRGMSRISSLVNARQNGPKVISGKEAFELYDTYGFPVDLTAIEAEEHGFTVDEDAFAQYMEQQRSRSRESAKFYDMDDSAWVNFQSSGGQRFAGYGLTEHETSVVRYKHTDDGVEIVLDSTPFYAEGGGELSDHGQIVGDNFVMRVTDVQRLNGIVHHIGELESGTLDLTGESKVKAHVDLARRAEKRVHHTATHLLHAALQTVLGSGVQQKGSVVATNRLRFDFSHGQPMTQSELSQVEQWVNAEIRANRSLEILEDVSIEDAKAQGVTALFGEKYGDAVRTVRTGPHSYELCGGNHVSSTGEIGYFMILGETGVAAGVRRVEAVAGAAAETTINEQRRLLAESASALKTEQPRVPERIAVLQKSVKSLKKELERAQSAGGGIDLDSLITARTLVANVPLVVSRVDVPNRGMLAKLMDKARDKAPDAAIVFLATVDGAAVVIGGLGSELKKTSNVHMGRFVGKVCDALDGRGGGRPDFAQGGGKNTAQIDTVIREIPAWFEETV